MKNCLWAECPRGVFRVRRRREDSNQLYLIQPGPPLGEVKEWVREQLAGGPITYELLSDRLLSPIWIKVHFHEALNDMREEGELLMNGGVKRVAWTKNPELALAAVKAL